MDKVSGADGVN